MFSAVVGGQRLEVRSQSRTFPRRKEIKEPEKPVGREETRPRPSPLRTLTYNSRPPPPLATAVGQSPPSGDNVLSGELSSGWMQP